MRVSCEVCCREGCVCASFLFSLYFFLSFSFREEMCCTRARILFALSTNTVSQDLIAGLSVCDSRCSRLLMIERDVNSNRRWDLVTLLLQVFGNIGFTNDLFLVEGKRSERKIFSFFKRNNYFSLTHFYML